MKHGYHQDLQRLENNHSASSTQCSSSSENSVLCKPITRELDEDISEMEKKISKENESDGETVLKVR